MRQLSPAGQQVINDIAQRHGVSVDAAMSMLDSVINGNGQMAQFNHPAFSGSGQWMRGGMTMVSDMFNHGLSSRVDALCNELSNLIASQPGLVRSGSFQSQSQGGGYPPEQTYSDQRMTGGSSQSPGTNGFGAASLFVPAAAGNSAEWWPGGLPWPSSTGSQNGARYAYFPQVQRLAIDVGGKVTVYDTLDHQIGGFAQQQSAGGSLSFNSQHGLIDVARLPVVNVDGKPHTSAIEAAGRPSPVPTSAPSQAATAGRFTMPAEAGHAAQPGGATGSGRATAPADLSASFAPKAAWAAGAAALGPQSSDQDIFAMIEKLAGLHAKGILTREEFSAKKIELLGRL